MKKSLFVVLTLISVVANAQNDIQFSHFMFNELIYNPAVAGNSNKIHTNLVARQQWMGVENAPSTQFLNAHTWLEKIGGGVGLVIINDKLGFENSLTARLNYAYHIRLSEKATISAGLSAGFINKRLDGTKLIFEEVGDQYAIYGRQSAFKPDFGFGFEFNSEKITAGIASTHVDRSMDNATIFRMPRHYFAYAKYKIKANDEIDVIPAFLMKSRVNVNQYELNSNVYYRNKYYAGMSYRLKESFIALVGFNITEEFRVGYSYDFNAKPVRTFSSGSHEIMISGTFKTLNKKKYNYKSPRFFN